MAVDMGRVDESERQRVGEHFGIDPVSTLNGAIPIGIGKF